MNSIIFFFGWVCLFATPLEYLDGRNLNAVILMIWAIMLLAWAWQMAPMASSRAPRAARERHASSTTDLRWTSTRSENGIWVDKMTKEK
jgi:hypothetical protein